MLCQVTHNFLLNWAFQHHQHKTQVRLDSEFTVLHKYLAMDPGPLEMDNMKAYLRPLMHLHG